MLARLLRKDDLQVVPKPLPPTLVSIPRQNQNFKRRSKQVRVCRLYPQPQPERLINAKALLAFIQEHSPETIGGYVPCADLDRFYRQDLCDLKGWKPRHWTGIARQLRTLTAKRTVRQSGERFVGYQIPRP